MNPILSSTRTLVDFNAKLELLLFLAERNVSSNCIITMIEKDYPFNVCLKLGKGTVSNGETNSKRNNAGNQTGSVSNNGGFIDGFGMCGKRGHGSSKSSNGGGLLLVLHHEIVDRLRGLVAHGKRSGGARTADRGETRNASSGGHQKNKSLLERLHFASWCVSICIDKSEMEGKNVEKQQ